MTVGRRPKPPELRELGGNAGKRAIPKGLDLSPHSGRAPVELERATERLVWERSIRPLCRLGVVKRAHEGAAVLLCQRVAAALDLEERIAERAKLCEDLLDRLDQVASTLDRHLSTSSLKAFVEAIRALAESLARTEQPTKLAAEARQWLSEFGLTPASSAKLVAPQGEDDPLAKFLESA